MDADTILSIKPSINRYLAIYDHCFSRSEGREHMQTYVQGQLSDLRRKSVEPIADAHGVPPRTLQQFLSRHRWDDDLALATLQARVARLHHHNEAIGVIDETSFAKKGKKTACVQRQHCGSTGKIDNCVVSVHLGYTLPDTPERIGFHTLIDAEPFLPETTWGEDRDRCRLARIPDDVVYRPKWKIALEQHERAVGRGIHFRWLTFDEGYSSKPAFLRELDKRGQDWIGEVPVSTRVWTRCPEVLHIQRRTPGPGRPKKLPRLKVKNLPQISVKNALRYSNHMHRVPWERYRVKDTSRGPMVWEGKRLEVFLKGEDGLPAGGCRAYQLLVVRNVLDPEEVKYYLSNAGSSVAVSTLMRVAFSRWKVERLFQDSKQELGLGHFEVRMWPSLKRHLLLCCISHLFLSEFRKGLGLRGGKGGGRRASHAPAAGDGDGRAGAAVEQQAPLLAGVC